jgi:N-acetyl-gamma-glutamyl-phosphate reductase
MGHRVAVYGASGYAGGEVVRLVDAHPDLETAYLGAHSAAGASLRSVHPQLGGGERVLGPIDPEACGDVDLAFLALPHGASAPVGVALAERGVKVVDLGSDFRFATPGAYTAAYGTDHPHPEELGRWAYGLPELFGDRIAGSDRTAAPGCYPTAAVLALAPLLAAGAVDPEGIVVDAVSGVTGAGRGARADLSFGAVADGVRAYGLLTHRHRPEMEEAVTAFAGTSVEIVFTPHLVPMQRGILATCHARWRGGGDPAATLRDAYREARFVEVIDEPPQTRWTVGSNRCLLAAYLDDRTGRVIVLSAIDNLIKGAAGQAVQCANLMLGLDEGAGLSVAGWMP